MIDPTKLFDKKGEPSSGSTAATPEEKASGSSAAQMPDLEIPPGLPQSYVDANLKNQPIPAVLEDANQAEAAREPQKNFRVIEKTTLCNVENIPYAPGHEPASVTERVSQGPRVHYTIPTEEGSRAHEEKKPKPPVAKVIHPDTSKPGRVVRGEPPPYRPI